MIAQTNTKYAVGASWMATSKCVYVVGCCFPSVILLLGVVFGHGFRFSSLSVSDFTSRWLFFSGVIQCDRDDGCRHEARDGGFLR